MIPIRRIIVSSRRNDRPPVAQRRRILPYYHHRGGDRSSPPSPRRGRGIADDAARGSGGGVLAPDLDEDGYSSSSSCHFSYRNCLAWGAAVVASSSFAAPSVLESKGTPSIGGDGDDGDDDRLRRRCYPPPRGGARRGYHRPSAGAAASCEPKTSPETPTREIDGPSSEKSNDYFFDAASDLGGVMRRVMSNVDEINHKIKSSLPNAPSSSSSSSGVEDDARRAERPDGASSSDESSVTMMFGDFLSLAESASSLLFTTREKTSAAPAPTDIQGLIQRAHGIAANHRRPSYTSTDGGSSMSSSLPRSSGFMSQVLYLQQNAQAVQRAFESLLGNNSNYFQDIVDVGDYLPANPLSALHYYLEHQEAEKTPSWKRRMHRYQRSVEVAKVEELNEALLLSELSYADGVEEVRAGLEALHRGGRGGEGGNINKPQWELLFCDTESRPGEPSHFLAIQKNASPYDDVLRVLMVVRGTKSMSDLITDAMMAASDYEYAVPGGEGREDGKDSIIRGKAHSGMQLSGRWLVDRHLTLLSTLLQLSKKRKIDITLIGHSLGAGAATIAAMEWNSQPFGREKSDSGDVGGNAKNGIQVSAHVIGFGCPALLSKSLSLATKDYVTTVIADADFIPRMSGATLVNVLLDMKNFDYRMQAERDVEQALRELQSKFSGQSALSFNIAEDDIQSVMGYVRKGLEKVTSTAPSAVKSTNKTKDGDDANNIFIEKTKDYKTQIVKNTEPVLFPPGECIHFYRDGSGISGSYVPCDFFNEIDVARTMVDDHLISSGYRRIFLNLMRDFTQDDHFSFEGKGPIK
ncbi:hypothetical protein ACHAW5_002825 [Stephanodiscus triporus]|uniref:Fungal lipase-type domain-containing protein n=1 Tax=Stephanodiscus triporus TaxID=2934178 RepID=A0ABD3PSG6_9STRA